MSSGNAQEEAKVQLLEPSSLTTQAQDLQEYGHSLSRRFLIESKKLWEIVGPAILTRIAQFSVFIVTQAFAGHIGDLELAAMSIAVTLVLGFNFGLLLGMASALETLCGQAFGAKNYCMLGIYLQRSFIVLFFCCVLTTPIYIFATPILKLLGQAEDIAKLAGFLGLCFLPVHFCCAFQFPLQRFLQSQLKNNVLACVYLADFILHVFLSWLVVVVLDLGLVGAVVTLNFTWSLSVLALFAYCIFGGCLNTWSGFSFNAFSGLWEFVKLSTSSGIMLCLENWYYRILMVMTGNLNNAAIELDALSICMNINSWEMMIPLAFFAGTGVRVANELGARNGKAARFAAIVSVTQSTVVGLFFCVLILLLHNKIAVIWTASEAVLKEVRKLSILLAFTILLNSVQPVLSGVGVGSGWQSFVAYINVGCYYLLGLPLGIVIGSVFHCGLIGIWAGMIFGGTAIQTLILIIITIRCDWEKEGKKASNMHKSHLEENSILE